jgi:hypothetical protein
VKRSTPLRGSPAAARAWQDRSRRRAIERVREEAGRLGRKRNRNTGTRARQWAAAKAAACRCCGRRHGLQLHHVVYEQHVRAESGDLRDPRNSLTTCAQCHVSHHGGGRAVMPLTALRSANFEFARELLGPGAAYEYLRRRYAGDDPRLTALLDGVA